MLKTIDVLIGFSVVMLVMSMAVTMLTQLATSTFNHRGTALKRGIADLLGLLDKSMTKVDAKKLADHLLRDPLVGSANFFSPGRPRLAGTVHREEFTKLLLEFAAADPGKLSDDMKRLQTNAGTSLAASGIADPKVTLASIRTTALELEKSHPEMANNDRLNTAILHNATSDFLGKLNAWFDQTIDRVSDRFTLRARMWTIVAAVLVAGVFQLDAVVLINRLSTDDKLRAAVVADAIQSPAKYDPTKVPAPGSAAEAQASLKNLGLTELVNNKLIELPTSLEDWWAKWFRPGSAPPPKLGTTGVENASAQGQGSSAGDRMLLSRIIGVIISAALMSLGAPFWYEMLKNMVRLRSVIATKDDNQRNERQTTQSPAPQTAAAAAV